ncbi:hypothetical protein FM038_017295 [Shewanella eurypsychrophilus]|uniref:Uncharacterized protein n=1 Tax=Shewanella eurypsychrophilus TaxID=2593656 RepID=A0ABX6V8X4_9GAMM|nr:MULTISPECIES: hypothetical protein [Shewanella]QFU23753.1 hypothetical protein FS418_19075 [Shewanella sp. YLB-09]QPG58976.1 hypothetical protein FM038_017295 [Shewanella eurypsychrophilus]
MSKDKPLDNTNNTNTNSNDSTSSNEQYNVDESMYENVESFKHEITSHFEPPKPAGGSDKPVDKK